MTLLIDKNNTLAAFDHMIKANQERLDKAIIDQDWAKASHIELWLSGLSQGRAIVLLAREVKPLTP